MMELKAVLFLEGFVMGDEARAWKLRGNGGVAGVPRCAG